MIKNNKKILAVLAIAMSTVIFAPVSSVKVQAKTIVQTIKDSQGNEDAKKLSRKLQHFFNTLRRVEYKDSIKESEGAKKLLIWLEQNLNDNKAEIEAYINSNKEFSKDISTLYKSCLRKRASVYSNYAAKFNIAIPSDIAVTPAINKVDTVTTPVKPVENKVEKVVAPVKPVENNAQKVVAPVKPVENNAQKVVAPVKPVENNAQKVVAPVKPVENNAQKENSKELSLQAKLPNTGSNLGGLALGIIGMISTMFGVVLSKINRK